VAVRVFGVCSSQLFRPGLSKFLGLVYAAWLTWLAATSPLRDLLLVAVGAIPGAWLRFRLVNHFEPLVPRKHWATFGVNITASFALGLIASLSERSGPDRQINLLLATGFLGSLSTFSTLMVELLQAWTVGSRQAILLMLGSVLSGLIAVSVGMLLGG